MTEPITVNWDEVLIRCSSLGCLFTEPVSKADKEVGKLSKTAKTHLKSVYILEKYGREKDIITKQMAKGLVCEEDSITLLSWVQKKLLAKNSDRLRNEYITGLPDLYEGDNIQNAETITDIKTSYDLHTFIANLGEPLNSDYLYQLQGYMWLSGAQRAYIAYCLVDSPAYQIEGEKYRLLKSLDVISEESPEYKRAAEKLEKQMTFQDIDKEDRVFIFTVPRDEEIISKIIEKVKKAREYLKEIEKMHTINQ